MHWWRLMLIAAVAHCPLHCWLNPAGSPQQCLSTWPISDLHLSRSTEPDGVFWLRARDRGELSLDGCSCRCCLTATVSFGSWDIPAATRQERQEIWNCSRGTKP